MKVVKPRADTVEKAIVKGSIFFLDKEKKANIIVVMVKSCAAPPRHIVIIVITNDIAVTKKDKISDMAAMPLSKGLVCIKAATLSESALNASFLRCLASMGFIMGI